MYSFQVVETFAGAALNLVSGISDMELVVQGGNVMLYTATRAGGGVLAIDVDAAMTLVDQELLAPGLTLPAGATLDLATIGGADGLIVSGGNQAGVQTYQLEAGGGLAAGVQLPGSMAGVIAAQAVVQSGGVTYFYAARANESTIHCYTMAANGTMTHASARVLDGTHPGVDIGSMTSFILGGETYLVTLSLEAEVVRTFRVGSGGVLAAPVMLGAPQGLGIADPSDVKIVTMAGVTYLLVASAGSSSVSVIAVGPGGQMTVTDHVVDTLDTRFQGVQTLATAVIGDRVFVIAGGGDDGLNLMTLTPDGRLVLVATGLQVPDLALHNITAMTARVVDGVIDLFVAGEGSGITRLQLDPGDLAGILTGDEEGDTLTGSDAGDLIGGGGGDDILSGGAGADILMEGAGEDVLYGGAGADIFVLEADGETDTIADFQLGIDRIDLSAWGARSILDLTITATPTGAVVTWHGETLLIQSANGLPIQPDVFQTSDVFPLWHAPPDRSDDSLIIGTIQTDFLQGGAEDDHFLVTIGADTILGGDGFDCISLARAAGWVRINLGSNAQNTSIALGQTYMSIEGVVGSAFNDQLIGDGVANMLDGGDGTDRLSGLEGDDSLYGGNGSDTLTGGAGADRLDGGTGRDRASYRDAPMAVLVDMTDPARNTGEAAGDAFVGMEDVEGGSRGDTILGDAQANALYGIEGNDSLAGRLGNDTLAGGDGNDTLMGGAGADRLDGAAGIDLVSYAENGAAIRIDLMTATLNTGEALGDTFIGIEGFSLTGWGDSFYGNADANQISGLGGNDTLAGRGGDDQLFGGAGSDSLLGEDGNDTLAGGAGADRLTGGAGRDMVSYADALAAVRADMTSTRSNTGDAAGDLYSGIEDLGGSAFADTLFGDTFANLMRGEAGNDSLSGRAGNDTLAGGDGNDTLTGGAGADVLDGGAGVDTVAYGDATKGLLVDLATPGSNSGDAAGDVFSAIEAIAGSAHADTLAGDGAGNVLTGGAGNDRLEGREGDDVLLGDAGNDTLIGGAGTDRFEGGLGADLVSYAAETEGVTVDLMTPALNGGAAAGDSIAGVEQITATGFDDALAGDGLANLLRGEAGDDRLSGRAGNDWLSGGDGNDMLLGGSGADGLDGGAGFDLASYADALAGVRIDMTSTRSNTGDAAGDVYSGIEALAGSGFADVLSGDLLANGLDGGTGNDSLAGRAGNDTLAGGDGNDKLTGGVGADLLDGGEGIDIASYGDALKGVWVDLATPGSNTGDAAGDVFSAVEGLGGSAYADTLSGDGGANPLTGGAGNDSLDGRAGDDVLDGGAGRDTLIGGDGVDTASYLSAKAAVTIDLVTATACTGDAAGDQFLSIERFDLSNYNDRAFGGALHNVFQGHLGNDLLAGRDGQDQLFGGAGNDTLQGGEGDDILAGGAGRDSLDGGAGRDLVSYTDATAGVLADLANAAVNRGDALGDRYLGVEDIAGSAHADTLAGDAGQNAITGGGGHDSLAGRDGDDTLAGGAGNDTLGGGAGADMFLFHEGQDVILDFTDDQDSIVVDASVWGGAPLAMPDLLNAATMTATGLILALAPGHTLDIRGIFDASLLADDIVFL